MKKETINIKGMSCSHCIKAVENELSKLSLEKFTVEIGKAVVEFNESNTGIDEIKTAIEDAGYEISEII